MFLPLVVGCALFMENLDATIITTALPAMAATFRVNPLSLSLGITAYIVGLAAFIPISGWISDRFGARPVFVAAIAIFTVGSAICGFSESAEEFIAARILQSVGGAMMVPVGRLLLFRTLEKPALLHAMTYVTLLATLGTMVGPPVGGFITTFLSWRWIFFLNLPFGIVGIAMVARLTRGPSPGAVGPLDWIGFILIGSSVGALMYGLDLAGRRPQEALSIAGVLAASSIAGALGVAHARRYHHGMLDLRLFRIPTFSIVTFGGLLFRVGMGTLPFLLPLTFQLCFGMSPFDSGLMILASSAGTLAMKVAAPLILRRFGFKTTLVVNAVVSSFLLLSCVLIAPETPTVIIFLILLAVGFFRSLQFTSLTILAFADIPDSQMSSASSITSTQQQLCQGLGVAFGAILLHVSLAHRAAGDALIPMDFQFAFGASGLLSLLSLPFFRRLSSQTAIEISGHAPKSDTRLAPCVAVEGDRQTH